MFISGGSIDVNVYTVVHTQDASCVEPDVVGRRRLGRSVRMSHG